ncbi:retinoic acid receptor responder protein 3-like [Echeneis naucrates]|uniref:Retinoic acid receptor responder protein 3-like n=1 Tax=Echeneis naucrates TaxID=173247 RepID=A0A665VB19_ECHNA|nr:retinoic acid receptor responder protein 3-like [Echeneis naucrates]
MAPTLFDSEPKPGDLIEIFRGFYQHWAIYIGENEVVHLIPPNSDSGSLDLLMFMESSTATVRRQKVWDVIGCHDYHINNLLDEECEPHSPDVIVKEACGMVGRDLPYNISSNNCEHFVTELRYGKPESRQVKRAQTLALVGGAAAAGVAFAVLGAALFSSFNKENNRNNK